MSSRLNYANVMSAVAVFLTMTGTALAAGSLAAGSVGTKHLKRNAVTSAKIKNRTIRVKDMSTAAVTALKGQTGATGARGASGEQGEQGERGPSTAYSTRHDDNQTLSGVEATILTQELPAGSYVITAKLDANNNDIDDDATVVCRLYSDATEIDKSLIGTGNDAGFNSVNPLTLVAGLTTAATTSITIKCVTVGADANSVFAEQASLVAVQVGTLSATAT